MRSFIVGINSLAGVVSLIWLWGHSSAPGNTWEFWFALGYLSVAALNLYYHFRRERREEELLPEADEA